MRRTAVVLTGMLCFGPLAAVAADTGLYFDVTLGQSKANDISKSVFDEAALFYMGSIGSATLDDQASFWSTAVGFRASRYFAVDLGYADLGDFEYRATDATGSLLYKASASSSGPVLTAMGILPIGERFEFQGRAGVLFSKTEIKEYLTDFSNSASAGFDAKSRDPFVGIGAAFNVTDTFTIHADVRRYLDVGDKNETGQSDIDVATLGVTFSQ